MSIKLKLKKIYEDRPCEGCYFMVQLYGDDGCACPMPKEWSETNPLISCEYFDPNDYATIWVIDK